MRKKGGGRREGTREEVEVRRARGKGDKKFQLTKASSKSLSKICLEVRIYKKVPSP